MSQTVLPFRAHSSSPRVVLLTGVTGFVGQAVLERFLREEARVHVVIRGSGDTSAVARLDELLTRAAFDPWRAEVGPAGVARARARIHVIEADLSQGLPPLPADLDLVVHSASSVSFDDPWDVALHANVLGPTHLYEALTAAGADPHVIHISTSYVGTDRHALAPEASVDHDIDWRAEIETARALRHEVESSIGEAGASHTTKTADARLRDAGRERAHELGWTDVYTMSKSFGERAAEQLWADAGHRLTILRPTIIESALSRPFPGWIDGFKVADPLIAAFAKGRLVAFPGHAGAIIDIVPVDVVVDAAMAAAYLPTDGTRYLQVGTGRRNPITLGGFSQHVEAHIHEHPWTDRNGAPIHPKPWSFLPPGDVHSWAQRRIRALSAAERVLSHAGPQARGVRRRLGRAVSELALMQKYTTIYQAYTCSRTVYDDTQTRLLLAQARAWGIEGSLDVTTIDWGRYLRETHLPSLAALVQDHRRLRAASPGTGHDRSPGVTARRQGGARRAERRTPVTT